MSQLITPALVGRRAEPAHHTSPGGPGTISQLIAPGLGGPQSMSQLIAPAAVGPEQ
jgi:hypothetical protein